MPTARPRHTITETDEIEEALAIARRRWPEERPANLLRRLALEGAETLAGKVDARAEGRREAIDRHAGALSGCYPEGYLERLRAEWPE